MKKIKYHMKVMLLNHHFWASECVVVTVSAEPRPLPVF